MRGHDEREVLLLPVLREKLKQLNPMVLTRDGCMENFVARYQQYHAVRHILARSTALDLPPEKRRGLIWHKGKATFFCKLRNG